MPELPEVETVRRQLEPQLRDTTITELEIRDPRWCAPLDPAQLRDIVVGRRVHALRRRGKYLDWVLDEEIHLLMHLRMTGTLLLDPPTDTPYTRVEITLDAGRRLRFVDPRRFGTGWLVAGDAGARAVLRHASGHRAVRRRLHAGGAARAGARAAAVRSRRSCSTSG